MSLEVLWSLGLAYPAQVVNGLALFLALAGSWLLLATRWRERRALARVLMESEGEALLEALAPSAADAALDRLNRFFYAFGLGSLGGGLALSWFSTTLSTSLAG